MEHNMKPNIGCLYSMHTTHGLCHFVVTGESEDIEVTNSVAGRIRDGERFYLVGDCLPYVSNEVPIKNSLVTRHVIFSKPGAFDRVVPPPKLCGEYPKVPEYHDVGMSLVAKMGVDSWFRRLCESSVGFFRK
jgi:hypothetical protein